jgi:hypothetical protein
VELLSQSEDRADLVPSIWILVAEEERERLGITPQMRDCIEAASMCYTVCTETLTYSLNAGAALSEGDHIRFLIDCCEVCQTTQNSLLRVSAVGTMLVAVCAEACERVAESCRRVDESDEQLALCAATCDRTADACRGLAI